MSCGADWEELAQEMIDYTDKIYLSLERMPMWRGQSRMKK